jgi:hypothetical protein
VEVLVVVVVIVDGDNDDDVVWCNSAMNRAQASHQLMHAACAEKVMISAHELPFLFWMIDMERKTGWDQLAGASVWVSTNDARLSVST